MGSDFKTNANVVYSSKYHGVWCPKYASKILFNSVDTRLKEIIHQTAQEFPWLRSRLPRLWTNWYFVATVGGAPLAVIKQYIENQKGV
jgi:putative transposase